MGRFHNELAVSNCIVCVASYLTYQSMSPVDSLPVRYCELSSLPDVLSEAWEYCCAYNVRFYCKQLYLLNTCELCSVMSNLNALVQILTHFQYKGGIPIVFRLVLKQYLHYLIVFSTLSCNDYPYKCNK